MRQDERAPFVQALRRARMSAYAPGEFVEQESFMLAGEILALARRAGIAPGVSVLDLCCGVAGPGRFITQELGCTYLGWTSPSAIDIARDRAAAFPVASRSRGSSVPPGPFDVVLLLETMLAFPEKETPLHGYPRRSRGGALLPSRWKRGFPSRTQSERACPTPTRSGSRRCRKY
jgi:hypothetical protein